MNGSEYQKLAMRTATELPQKEALHHGLHMLSAEAGECNGLMQKTYQGHELLITEMIKELGDCCWAIARVCDAIGVSFDQVLEANIEKLKKRYPTGFSADRSVNRND